MCWSSAEYEHVEQAKVGQRLGIRTMNWHANWIVRETEMETARPCPVCLVDRTGVLFRFSEIQQASLQLGSEAEAVFKMLHRPIRDIFEFAGGRQITLSELPAGLIFDVLVVPGLEELSAILEKEPAVQEEEEREKESFLVRLMARL
jgi:hypothetical protein